MTRLPDGREIDVEAIRARDAASTFAPAGKYGSVADRRNLLALVDALRAAAGKVSCERCGMLLIEQSHDECTGDCPDCTDLRGLLK